MSNQEQTTNTDVQTFNNDHLSVTVTKLPHCLVKFDIFVQPEALAASYAKAKRSINKEINIPGFRKGKAPEKLIMERFGSAIQKEWVDISLQTAFNDAIQLTDIHPLKDGMIKRPVVHECDKEKGGHFTIEFETRPHVSSINFEDLQIHRIPAREVKEKDKKQALKQLVTQYVTYEPVTDRPVQEGDFVDLDVAITEEGISRQIVNNQRTQVAEEDLPSWIRSKVVGLNEGESAEGVSERDEDTMNQPDFQSRPFKVTVNAIWTGKVPEIDDELAQKLGLSTAEELRQKVDERLEREAREEAHQLEIQQLEKVLLEKYHFELPESIIDRNLQVRLADYKQQAMQQYPNAPFNFKEVEKKLRESTVRHLQLLFLLHKIAADHHVELTQEDVNQELGRQIALVPSGRSQINLAGDKEELRNQVQSLAFDHKIKQFLLDKATFIEG